MRIFATSDVHVDYAANAQWVESLSLVDYQNDVLILAGDVTDSLQKLERCFGLLARRFMKVLFVPGNHDLWVIRDKSLHTSLQKLDKVRHVANQCNVSMDPFHRGTLSIVPLMSWYDYSFGKPSDELKRMWADFRACRWPDDWDIPGVAAHFQSMNRYQRRSDSETIITFSHFLPRIDVMPDLMPPKVKMLYPILGTRRLEPEIRRLGSTVHVYGHSHLNRRVHLDGTLYVNNAFAYPQEASIAAKNLACIHEQV
jgi:predicted phosphodiesterase